MSEGGKKLDQQKPQMDLLNTTALIEIAKVMTYGASKYGRFNWRKGIEWSRIISAADRHMKAFNDGENVDQETQLSHVAHAACNLMMLLQYIQTHNHLDDRYKADGQAEGTIGVRNPTSREQETSCPSKELKKTSTQSGEEQSQVGIQSRQVTDHGGGLGGVYISPEDAQFLRNYNKQLSSVL